MNILLDQYADLLTIYEHTRIKNEDFLVMNMKNILYMEHLMDMMNDLYDTMHMMGIEASQSKVNNTLMKHVIYGTEKIPLWK